MVQCWWCGEIANTREHKIKKVVIEKLMFKDPLDNKIYLHKNEEHKIVQSPQSKLLKYEENLCEFCNTCRSQPFDRAYDVFFKHIISNEKSLASSLKINMKLLQIDQANLFRYFIKSFCCMVDSTKNSRVC